MLIRTHGFDCDPVLWQSSTLCSLCCFVVVVCVTVVVPPPLPLVPLGQPPAGAGTMSRPPWCASCAFRALRLIVISTYGFVLDPVAWQMVTLSCAASCVWPEEDVDV